jgi:hypothetical protein
MAEDDEREAQRPIRRTTSTVEVRRGLGAVIIAEFPERSPMSDLRRALASFALLFLAGVFGTTGARAEDFALRIDRPESVGQRSHITGMFRSFQTQSFSANGKEAQETKDQLYRFDLTSQVLEVSAKGNVLESMLTIHQLTREENGKSTALLPGEIVLARFDKGEKVLEVRGEKLPKELSEALRPALSLHADEDPTDDDLLGTGKRRSLGESWPLNSELLVQMLQKKGTELTFTLKDVTGTVKLAGRKPLGDIPCFDLESEIEIRNPTLSAKLPDGVTATIPALKMTFSMLLPVDPTVAVGSSSFQMEMTALLSGNVQGVPVTGRLQMRQEASTQSVPVANPSPAASPGAAQKPSG